MKKGGQSKTPGVENSQTNEINKTDQTQKETERPVMDRTLFSSYG